MVDGHTLYESNVELLQNILNLDEEDVEGIINLLEANADKELPTKHIKFQDIDARLNEIN